MNTKNDPVNRIPPQERHLPRPTEPMQVISENLKPPAKQGDIGYNLVCDEDAIIRPGQIRYIKTSAKVKLPANTWGLIAPRSSAAAKHGLHVIPGFIDNGYTGELLVGTCSLTNQTVTIRKGMSIAQLVLMPMVVVKIDVVDVLPVTDRGEAGFGSTGL